MLAYNPYTGAMYDVPGAYGAYPDDGLGAYGAWTDFLNIIPGVGPALKGIVDRFTGQAAVPGAPGIPSIPGISSLLAPLMPHAPGVPTVPGLPGGLPGALAPALPFPLSPGALPSPLPFAPTIPPGWMRPLNPFAARAPRHVYMRCGVWPGRPGLVPTSAGAIPGALPVQPFYPALPAAAPRHRRRRRRAR